MEATTGAFVTYLGRIRKKGTWLAAKFPLFIVIVPLKLFFVEPPQGAHFLREQGAEGGTRTPTGFPHPFPLYDPP